MIEQCFFCKKGADEDNPLHVSSYDMDTGLKNMVSELQDTQLLARIVGSDLMAMDATYHLTCLTHLRNRYRSHMRQLKKATTNTDDIMNEARTFVELAGHIEMSVNAGTLIFKLSELHTLYLNRLEELNITKAINKTRCKEQLFERFSDAQAQHDGRNIVIIFKDGMKDMIKDAVKKRDFTEDALRMVQAATLVRKGIFHHEGFQFTGQFPPGCQEKSLPSILQCLVSMILNGPNLIESNDSQVCLTVGQTIVHNVKKRKPNSPTKVRHTLDREPPLPIYIGINIHALARSKKIIQQLHQMGISVSYDRVMQIEEWLATAVCERFEDDGVVAPTILRKGLFTVGALDNLDHNPTATTATTYFYGTGISTFQFPSTREPGVIREPVTLLPARAHTHSLPDHYAYVPAVSLKSTGVQVPESNSESVKLDLAEAKHEEYDWIKHISISTYQ